MSWAPDNVRKWSTLALLALMGTALTAAINPGFSAIISQKGLDFACQEGVTVLQKELETIKVPNFSGIFRMKHLGKGSYEFYSMAVNGFHIPNPQISLLPTDRLQLSIKDASIKIRGRWKSRKNFLKASGKFDLSVQGVFISADLKLGRNPPGRITVECSACSSHIDRVHIQISGSMLGWLIQLFHKKIETSLRNSISEKICRTVTISVSTKLQPYIQTLPVVARVDEMAAIDYSLLNLTTTAEFLEGQLKLPKDSKFRLNTEFLGTFLPKVAMKFPSTEVQLLISASSPPRLSIHPSGLSLDPALETQAFAVLLNSSLVPLFLVHMNTNVSLEVDAEADRLVGEMKLEKLTLELKHSDFGSFKVELLQAVINYLMPTIVLPKINERLRRGFPLPLPAGVRLNNLMFQSYQNFLVLGADVHRT